MASTVKFTVSDEALPALSVTMSVTANVSGTVANCEAVNDGVCNWLKYLKLPNDSWRTYGIIRIEP